MQIKLKKKTKVSGKEHATNTVLTVDRDTATHLIKIGNATEHTEKEASADK